MTTDTTVDPIRHVGRTIIIKASGERALVLGQVGVGRPGWVQASTEFSPFISRGYHVEEIELAPKRDMTSRAGYDLKEDLAPIMTGLWALPNFEPYKGDPLAFLNTLTLGGLYTPPGAGYAKLSDGRKGWAKFFLSKTQGGAFDGTGHVIVYASPSWVTDETAEGPFKGRQVGGAIIGNFAICRHQKTEEGYRPNHQRGWHPGHCKLCGMDLSYDSGD